MRLHGDRKHTCPMSALLAVFGFLPGASWCCGEESLTQTSNVHVCWPSRTTVSRTAGGSSASTCKGDISTWVTLGVFRACVPRFGVSPDEALTCFTFPRPEHYLPFFLCEQFRNVHLSFLCLPFLHGEGLWHVVRPTTRLQSGMGRRLCCCV